MVDDRFAKNQRYMNSLSRWVRSDVVHYSNCNQMLSRLESFKNEMIEYDKENDRIAALYKSAEVNQQEPSNFRFANQGSKASGGGKGQKNWKSTKRKPSRILYDTDSSIDAPSPMYKGSEPNASSASKLRKQFDSDNKNPLQSLISCILQTREESFIPNDFLFHEDRDLSLSYWDCSLSKQ